VKESANDTTRKEADNGNCSMSAKILTFSLMTSLLTLSACQDSTLSTKYSDTNNFKRSIRDLSPELPDNQLGRDATYDGQILLTVKNDKVVKDLLNIEEMQAATEDITYLRSNESFSSEVYVVHFHKNINPIPYYNYLKQHQGVIAAQFEGIVGLAATSE
jgi:hypothetical protein